MSITDPCTHTRVLSEEAYQGLLNPRRVALIGASDDPKKSAGRPLRYLQRYGFSGQVIPVNPARSHVLGVPALPSLDAVEDDIDLAVILTSAERGTARSPREAAVVQNELGSVSAARSRAAREPSPAASR